MAEPTPAPVTSKTRSTQNRAMGSYITLSGTILTTCLTNDAIAQKLATRSYNATKIGAGVALQNAAQLAYNERQSGLGDRETSVQDQGELFRHERAEFLSFRELALPFFPEKGDRTDLNLIGTTPNDMSEFVTFARTTYTNAKGQKFQEVLAPLGYDTAKLDEELTELENFSDAISNRQQAGGGAKTATGDRNTAFRALETWMKQLEGVAKNVLGSEIDKLPFDDLPRVSIPKQKA